MSSARDSNGNRQREAGGEMAAEAGCRRFSQPLAGGAANPCRWVTALRQRQPAHVHCFQHLQHWFQTFIVCLFMLHLSLGPYCTSRFKIIKCLLDGH
jgi:hypothetical protein